MEKSKKALPIMLAAALASTPFVIAPQSASAISSISIDPSDDGEGEESTYKIDFTIDKALDSGDSIYIDFPKGFEIDSGIDEDDIDADFDVRSVKASGRKITIRVDENLKKGSDLRIEIKDGIKNPEDKGSYSIDISTSSEDREYESVKIKSGSSSSKKGSSDDYSVDIDDSTEKKETQYEIGPIKLKDKLTKGDYITVTFPSSDMLPSKITKNDIDINKYTPDSVEVSGRKVEIKVPSKAADTKELTLKFYKSAGITNPSAGDKYTIDVRWDGVTYTSKKFDIKKSGSSSSSSTASDFTVSLSDSSAGARTSFSFEADFGKTELKSDRDVIIEFPSSDMIPGYLNPEDFKINGKTPKRVGFGGNSIALATPSNFSSSKTVKVDIDLNAWLTNPKAAGDYTLKMTVDGKTATSKSFKINASGTGTVTPTPTQPTPGTTAPANNSTATITLTNTAVGKQTGFNIAVKAFGAPLVKQRDFIEIVFPVGYKVPGYIAPGNVSVNGVASSFVAVRGQNVLVYPAQDIAAGTGANIVIGAAANIVNPTAKNTYTINVFSSEERGLLFGRAVGVGVPQPAQPVQQPAPQQPKQPAQQPSQQPQVNVPQNAVLFKVNGKSFTIGGKVYPLQEAPFLSGNTTMVPAQFFKEAMALTTQWNNQMVVVVKGKTAIRFNVGSTLAYIGNQEYTLPAPVTLKNGMPMVPIRFVTDNLGYKVGWDAKTSSVFVYQ
ncbi:copper amine oxidase N-terminal domain-containing protein [Brevibacillus borstelensis]|uniref:copper amine oxidase N-terminal domain-containing protein n=1 Tax=Brevibacillus borstelensis TaxID=45462 RepID=UPI0030C5163D